MPTATGRGSPVGHQEELERLARAFDASHLPAVTQAMRAVLTAMDYNDPALLQSSMNEAGLALADAIGEEILRQHKWVALARDVCRGTMRDLTCVPAENFDETGRSLESFLDNLLRHFAELRDQRVSLLLDRGYEVRNADCLARDIEDLQALKTETLGDWPWSWEDRPPPLNREMVERSRATIALGGGEPIEDLIRRLRGNQSN
jgi:hypothetical protein